jgi:arylsulfatase A-like enzyme
MDAPDTAPDLLVSFKWTDEKNEFGAPGNVLSEGGKRNAGTHASLSRFDMHNTLIGSGPSFRSGFINELPSSNADVAPTILSILGVKPPQPMDGRVLSEALVGGKAPSGKPKTETAKASRTIGLRQWDQYLKTTTFGGAFYVDEGNGGSKLRTP